MKIDRLYSLLAHFCSETDACSKMGNSFSCLQEEEKGSGKRGSWQKEEKEEAKKEKLICDNTIKTTKGGNMIKVYM